MSAEHVGGETLVPALLGRRVVSEVLLSVARSQEEGRGPCCFGVAAPGSLPLPFMGPHGKGCLWEE